MIRRLVVLRHAKSAYPPGMPDHDRPLAPRGVSDAKAAGAWLAANIGAPDHVVVSTARRARSTWTLAASALGYIGAAGDDAHSPGPLTVEPRVYEASPETLLDVVREFPSRVGTAYLIGHNPGCEMLVDLLAGDRDPGAAQVIAVKYPTSGIAVLELESDWAAIAPRSARLSSFAVPRG